MVSIDKVYQKVLILANKEQRGYITPQEFNLLADQAQKEIIDQYFYDINQFSRMHGNSTEYSDMLGLLDEKLSVLKGSHNTDVLLGSIGLQNLPFNLYKIGTLIYNGIEIEEVNSNELLNINRSPLAKPTLSRPIYVQDKNGINIYPKTIDEISMTYVREPSMPNWGYLVINEKALYNDATSVNFEVSEAEEPELVYRILALAGIAIQRPQLTQVAAGLEQGKVQQEKK
tara:strand:- start:3177 stop:3863 length:687 start_codon:yes stop_codon:yes gene_type:complete